MITSKILIRSLCVGWLAAPLTVGASPITHAFSGQIRSVDDPLSALAGSVIAIGALFTGTITYDPNNPPERTEDWGDGASASSWSDGALAISAVIGESVSLSSTPASVRQAIMNDGVPVPLGTPKVFDLLTVNALPIAVVGAPIVGPTNFIEFAVQDNSATAFMSSRDLPLTLDLNSFDSARFVFLSGGSVEGEQYVVTGEITSLYPVPEPGSLTLLGLGLAGLGCARRRKTAQQFNRS